VKPAGLQIELWLRSICGKEKSTPRNENSIGARIPNYGNYGITAALLRMATQRCPLGIRFECFDNRGRELCRVTSS